jgi:PhnB protein
MGSDMAGPGGVIKGNAISLALTCSTKEELETLFAKLFEGGKVGHPLTEQFFGTIGDFTDKFGIDWMLVLPSMAM